MASDVDIYFRRDESIYYHEYDKVQKDIHQPSPVMKISNNLCAQLVPKQTE